MCFMVRVIHPVDLPGWLTYLAENGQLPFAACETLIEALDDPGGPCTLVPLDRLVATALQFV